MRHAVCAQRIQFGQAQLQCMVAKHVSHGRVQLGLFPRQQVAARWRLKPIVQTYNRTILSTTHAPVTNFFLCLACCRAITDDGTDDVTDDVTDDGTDDITDEDATSAILSSTGAGADRLRHGTT